MKLQRLIPSSELPDSLWSRDTKCVQLAPNLVSAWTQLLEAEGLLEKAKQPSSKSPVGGGSKVETDEHLTWRFTGSAARVQLAVLDPLDELDLVADAFAQFIPDR